MHFAIQREALVKSLKEVSNALAGRSVQPILSHICLQSVDEANILFKATDLDLFIESKSNAVVYAAGAIALPGKKLLEIVSKLPEDLVSFQTNEETMETSIQCGKAKISMAGMAAEDFPAMGEISGNGILIPADVLNTAIAQTCFAAASFDTGSVIGGVCMSINDGEFECIATDGNRLAYRCDSLSVETKQAEKKSSSRKNADVSESGISVSESNVNTASEKNKSIATLEKPLMVKAIIPARACSDIKSLIDSQSTKEKKTDQSGANGDKFSGTGEVRISMNNGLISFQTSSNRLSTRLISGDYPAVKELFPAECKYIATFDRQELISALDRVSVMTDEKKNLIRLHFEGDLLQITANTPDFGRAQDEVAVKFEGQVLDMAINVRYLLDVLRTVNSPEVTAEMNGSLQPMIIKEKDKENYKYLLMPVELRMA